MSKFIKVTEDGKTVLINVDHIVMLCSDSNGKAIVSVVPTVDRTCAIVTEESFDDVRRLVTE